MNNNYYLLNLTISGIKNIREDLRLDFYKKTVNKAFDPSNHRIKAIYGENGSGKTAVITAVQILKDLICNKTCLDNPNYQEFLQSVINVRDHKLHLECEFYHYTEPANQIYHYTIELVQDGTGDFGIESEELTYRKADYPASKVNVAENDIVLKDFGSYLYTNIVVGEVVAEREGNGIVEPELESLTRFIRLFKRDLVSIGQVAADDDNGKTKLVLDYGEYQLQLNQESRGIQRLVKLWPYLKAAQSDGIVFIDGLDRDINEIYFERLVRFFAQYGTGQLCLTANNSIPMRELKAYKNSIDFLSSDGKVTHWRIRGNFLPDSLYKSGMIENMPFNIQPEDFVGIID